METRKHLGEVLARIDHQKANLINGRMTDHKIGLLSGLGADCVRSMRRSFNRRRPTDRILSLERISKIARVLQCSPQWLLTGQDQNQTNNVEHRELADA